ncbi:MULTISPECIES: bifunctional metallophosphatase/5'-nucleotidase [Bacillaceae]|uniref:Bifunctional metallophosphatase/5'-nucleotidase n=1 Tax=Evansella alkalicola TaxID=745819 RepID=A0ABS6JUD4_9BACI|nr:MULTISPECIES: bifunctional UDP-sugar hydrolase/5'-nucleotidase [Bacillaceae]MBU9722151.1 bifunctional metallophosphatase/5'-nucleotidase [Bacillus alkalicola]
MSTKQLRILHTNDLHSSLDNWPSVVSWLIRTREEALQNGEDVLLFDIGDHADRVHPMTEGLLGKGNTSLLNQLHYDAVTIGNNEGMTFSKAELNSLYDHANFPILLANLFHESGERPQWAEPYRIITTKSGIKVGVTGVTAPFYTFYKTLGWNIADPQETLTPIVSMLRPEVDILICLSHLGLFEDEKLAEAFNDFDFILGAHTHHVLPEGKKIGNTWINQSGRSGKYTGNIKMSIDTTTDADLLELSNIEVRSEKIDTNMPDASTEHLLKELTEEALIKLNEEVTVLNEKMEVDWHKETPIIRLLCQGLKEWCKGEISMLCAGVLLEDLEAGPITLKDLHKICPHPINPATVMISGERLLEIIRQAQKKDMIEYELKGFGFRGKILGAMVFDGVVIDHERPSTYIQDKDILINGESLSKDRLYKLATLDMFTFGHLYPALSSIKEKQYYMPEFLRDILAWKLKGNY